MFIKKRTSPKRKRRKKVIPPKQKLLYAFLIVLSLLPSFWAISNIIDTKSQGLSGTKCSVSLYDSQNQLIVADTSILEFSSSRSVASIFTKMTGNMKKVSSGSVDLSRFENPLSADVSTNNILKKYKFYFSTSEDCYCSDENGLIYSIPKEDALLFLNSSYAESIYSNAHLPSLITANGESVTPKSVNWYYKNNAGVFLKSSKPSATTQENIVYEMSGALNFSFENNTLPDSCKFQVYQDGAIIFDGTYDNLSQIVIDIGTKLDIKVLAIWNNRPEKQIHGYATYEFSVEVVDYAAFTVNGDTVKQNGFLILRGSNIENISQIKFTPSKKNPSPYPFSPSFQRVGENVLCILPFTEEMKVGTYEFNVSYSVFSKNITIELTEFTSEQSYNSQIPYEDLLKLFDTEKQAEFQELVKEVTAAPSGKTFLRENFVRPSEFGYISEYTYRTEISSSDENHIYISSGNRYYSIDADNAPVYTLNSGQVVYTGKCDYLGSFIVIEHGLGLRTWYCNLSNINVTVGDYVSSGEQIGRCGSHYTSSYDGFLVLCSYDGVFININYCLYNDFEAKPEE